MNQREQIDLAMQAVRGQLRRYHVNPVIVTASGAQAVLDDMSRLDPGLAACQWYLNATDEQIHRFWNAWDKWRASEVFE